MLKYTEKKRDVLFAKSKINQQDNKENRKAVKRVIGSYL